MTLKNKQKDDRRKKRNRYNLKKNGISRLRLSVHRSNQNIYAQIIDDINGKTLLSASTMDKEFKTKNIFGGNVAAAQEIGSMIAKLAKDSGVKEVVFDRGSYIYHGRVKALAEAARGNGLVF
jgi:large subunit ribosomal protein L18